jgi:hypothetical protein
MPAAKTPPLSNAVQAIDLLCQQYTLDDKQLLHNAMHALSGEPRSSSCVISCLAQGPCVDTRNVRCCFHVQADFSAAAGGVGRKLLGTGLLPM